MKGRAIIIGAGMGGLGTACLLAKAGWDVTVLEKNNQLGGRAFQFRVSLDDIKRNKVAGLDAMQGTGEKRTEPYMQYGEGVSEPVTQQSAKRSGGAGGSASRQATSASEFVFDGGPSWYLMPDIFEHFFELLGEDIHKHLKLKKLKPSYRVFYKDTFVKADINSEPDKDYEMAEQLETGAGESLRHYLANAEYQYGIARDRFMYKNYDSFRDFLTPEMAIQGSKLRIFRTMNKHVGKYFSSEAMRKLLLYPSVFLGASPYHTPALYNMMSHVDFNMGVYYPMGGIYEIVRALQRIAETHGVLFHLGTGVKKIQVRNGQATGVILEDGSALEADIVISNADIYHTEHELLEPPDRTISKRWWQKRTMAPSAFIMYLGVKGKIDDLTHHNLLFSKDWKRNFREVFDRPRWPKDPSLYVCMPSKTDASVAPKGCENLFVLVPIAAGLKYDDTLLEHYADKILQTMEQDMHIKDLRGRLVYKKLFSVQDFEQRFNSYKGSALGLAHTLKQTAIFRPNNVSKKVKGLYFVGAGTNPGIGLPITLISAELLYKRLTGDKSAGPLKKL